MANEAYLALVCKKEEDFLGTFLFDSLPEVKESVESLLKHVLTTGISFNAPELAVPLNRFGEIKVGYFNFIYKALKEEDGVISGIIVIVTEVTDMVEARNSLAKDDKLFRNMVMQSPIPMAIFKDRNYIIESANNKMVEDVWRKETKQVLGKQVFEVFPELLRQNFNTIFDEVYDNNKVIKVEEARIYLLGNDGLKKMYLDYVVTPLVDTDGAISGISLTVNEVTKKVEDTQKLEEGEACLRLATEGTKLATWEMDLQTMDVIHSHRFAEILGIDIIKKLTYLEIGDLIDPRDREKVSNAFIDAITTSFYEVEARINWPDKTLHWIKTLGKIFYDENNAPSRLIGTIFDIMKVKLHEIEMGRLAAIVQTSEDAIISKGLDGIVITWNDASERMFGYKADEMIGKSISIIIPSNYRDEEASILLKMQEGNRINSFRSQRITKDKRILDISLTISAIKNTAGEIIGISKIARDITKQKLNEIQIAASEAKFKL